MPRKKHRAKNKYNKLRKVIKDSHSVEEKNETSKISTNLLSKIEVIAGGFKINGFVIRDLPQRISDLLNILVPYYLMVMASAQGAPSPEPITANNYFTSSIREGSYQLRLNGLGDRFATYNKIPGWCGAIPLTSSNVSRLVFERIYGFTESFSNTNVDLFHAINTTINELFEACLTQTMASERGAYTHALTLGVGIGVSALCCLGLCSITLSSTVRALRLCFFHSPPIEHTRPDNIAGPQRDDVYLDSRFSEESEYRVWDIKGCSLP